MPAAGRTYWACLPPAGAQRGGSHLPEHRATLPAKAFSAAQMREDLGLNLDADSKGQHKGHLQWGLLNLLIVQDKKVEINRESDPHLIVLAARNATEP